MQAVAIPVAVPRWMIDTTLALIEILPKFELGHFDHHTETVVPAKLWQVWSCAEVYGLITDGEFLHPDKYTTAGNQFFELTISEFFRYID